MGSANLLQRGAEADEAGKALAFAFLGMEGFLNRRLLRRGQWPTREASAWLVALAEIEMGEQVENLSNQGREG